LDGAGRVPAERRGVGAVTVRLGFLCLLLSGTSCGGPQFKGMTDPVQKFLSEVKSGVRGPARLKYCFSAKMEEPEIEKRIRLIADAIERCGSDHTLDIIGSLGPKAEIKVVFTGGEIQAFRFQVEYEEKGWRIRQIDPFQEGRG